MILSHADAATNKLDIADDAMALVATTPQVTSASTVKTVNTVDASAIIAMAITRDTTVIAMVIAAVTAIATGDQLSELNRIEKIYIEFEII